MNVISTLVLMRISEDVILWGGVGSKKSNKGTQFYIQDRIYSSNGLCPSLNTFINGYWIIIWDIDDEEE